MEQAAPPPERFVFLDGLRGWAALTVVLYHVFTEGFPATPWAATELRKFLPFSGLNAIGIFFILSGFALSTRFIATGDRLGLVRMAAGRYLRLAIPILVACTAVHLVMLAGMVPSERPPPFNLFLNFEPHVGHLLSFSLFEVFVSYSYTRSYIGPLWTIPIEILGSALVLGLLFVVGRWRWRWAAHAILIGPLLYLGSFQALFLIGVVLAELHAARWQDRLPQILFLVLFLIGCAIPFLVPWQVLWASLSGVAAVCIGALGYKPFCGMLSSRLSAALGKLSFPLYLAHGPMLFVVGIPLMERTGHNPWLMILAGLALVGVSILVALPLIPVNEFAIWIARRFGVAVTRRGRRLITRDAEAA